MPFEPLYGEPDWSRRPWIDDRGQDRDLAPATNKSYEENRLASVYEHNKVNLRLSKFLSVKETTDDSNGDAPDSEASIAAYLKWSQSPIVNFLVGPKEQSFRLPSGFLTNRSIPFRHMLEGPYKEADTLTIRLPELQVKVFNRIAIWAMSDRPALRADLPLDIVVEVALFATLYEMPALLHQSLDRLRDMFIDKKATWTPELLDRVYSDTEDKSLLRSLVRATMYTLDRPQPWGEAGEKALKEWQTVFEDHAALGFDYFVSRRSTCSPFDLSTGSRCRFHQHAQQKNVVSGTIDGRTCSRVRQECFEEVQIIPNYETGNWVQDLEKRVSNESSGCHPKTDQIQSR